MHERFEALPPGVSPYDFNAPGRQIPKPPSVEGGPFVEFRLAATPVAAWAGVILRRIASGEQPLWQILKDVRRYPVYRIEAPGIRVKDRHGDGRYVGGLRVLRKEGEEAEVHDEDLSLVTPDGAAPSEHFESVPGTSLAWRELAAHFEDPILGVVLPEDSPPWMLRPDWPLIVATPRLEGLVADEFVELIYEGERRMKIRAFRHLTDAAGKPIGRRFLYFLARQMAHDFFSPRRKRSRRDWLTLAVGVLTPLGALAGLASRVIDLVS